MEQKLGEFELNKVYCMGCLEGMKRIPDNSVDLIITDPPYGDNSSYGRMQKEIKGNEHPLLNLHAIYEMERILKDDSCIYNFTNWKHYPFLTEFILRYTNLKIRNMIVLNKNNIGMGYGFRNKHELIIVIEKGDPKYKLLDFANVLDFQMINHDEDTHPHEKPTNIIRKLIKHSSNENDIILDCFAGSGSILMSAKQLNRHFIGFDIESKWVELANNRLLQTILPINQLNIMEVKNVN